jgi:hypothetical protein
LLFSYQTGYIIILKTAAWTKKYYNG